MKEYILCAAIHYLNSTPCTHQPKNIESGIVVCGRRHHNCISVYFALTGNVTREETSVQGFITSLDRFVDRIEANEIAINANQVIGNTLGDQLISEDLY